MSDRPHRLPDRRQVLGLGSLIARSRRLVWAAGARRLESHGESILVWSLLNQLEKLGPLTQRELASVAGQHPAGVSRLLAQLEAEQLVRRARDQQDRRKVRVEVTEQGLSRLAKMDPELGAASRDVLSPLSAAEQATLRALLEKLLGAQAPGRQPARGRKTG